uniref:Uncharacterized protein n=1 Tax=Rhizophora mucronata TaxID=61149 RepID=A0A2P2M0Q9_RHIMU
MRPFEWTNTIFKTFFLFSFPTYKKEKKKEGLTFLAFLYFHLNLASLFLCMFIYLSQPEFLLTVSTLMFTFMQLHNKCLLMLQSI